MDNKKISVNVNEAFEIILNTCTPLASEKISLLEAQNRFLYDDIISNINIPPLTNSAMDGYAVISSDTINASKDTPVILDICDEIKAGDKRKKIKLKNKTAIRIMTGAPLPNGADSVIEFEETKEENNYVKIYKYVKHMDNCRLAGEDIKAGSLVLNKGTYLDSPQIGILASLNYSKIRVYKKPKVALISTGDEIIEIGKNNIEGKIRNSNAYTLISELKKYGAIPRYLGIAKDTKKNLQRKINSALRYDIIITTGGVSMGKYDFVKQISKDCGIDLAFEKIKMKPGRPCVFGKKNKTLFFGLPGNPVSCAIAFIEFVRPAILKMSGADRINKPVIHAISLEDIEKKSDRIHFLRGFFTLRNNELYVSTTGPQGSGILKSMSDANCLIIIPENISIIKAGEKVQIQLINHGEID